MENHFFFGVVEMCGVYEHVLISRMVTWVISRQRFAKFLPVYK